MADTLAAKLNGDCRSAIVDRTALQRAMQAQGAEWYGLVTERCQHLFADVPVFITAAQMRQMCEVIDAVERVVKLPEWAGGKISPLPHPQRDSGEALGVFFGYDFHLNSDGAHL